MLHPIDVASAQHQPSITAILSSAACTDPDINLALATAWLKVLIDWPGFGGSCKRHEDSIGNAARTYGGDGICHPQLLKVKLV